MKTKKTEEKNLTKHELKQPVYKAITKVSRVHDAKPSIYIDPKTSVNLPQTSEKASTLFFISGLLFLLIGALLLIKKIKNKENRENEPRK